jgi:hypothetical protein
MRARAVVGTVVVVLGCGVDALPSPSAVRDLRVLAISTVTPEVRAGASPRLRAFTLAPAGTAPAFVRWRMCAESDVADPRACFASPRGRDLGVGEGVLLPALDARGDVTSYLVFASVCAGVTPSVDAASGRARCADGSTAVEAFRRVVVRVGGDLNQPPGVLAWELERGESTVAIEGDTVTLPRCASGACGAWTMRVVPRDGSAERTPEGAESLAASFYATEGSLDRGRDTSDPGVVRPLTARWTVADGVSGARVAMVVRDLRGGEAVRQAMIQWQ